MRRPIAQATARRVDHGGQHEKGSDAEHHTQQRQQPGATPHGGGDLVRGGGTVTAGPAEQSDPDGLDEGGRGQPTGEGQHSDPQRHGHLDCRVARGQSVEHALKEQPLAHEAAQRRQGADGEAGHDEHGGAQWQSLDQATELVQAAQPRCLLEGAGREEQRALEDGMEDEVQEGGHQSDEASERWPVAAKRPEAPTPSNINPTLSVVE